MEHNEIFNLDFGLAQNKANLPKNVYAIKVLNVDKNELFYLSIRHDGYTPILEDDDDESDFGEYLSNLEGELISDYFKSNKKRMPKEWRTLCEIMTDGKGELYYHSVACSELN